MNKLNELKKEIQKQIPHILDLVFGCVVDVGYPEPHYAKVLRTLKSNEYRICNYIRNSEYKGLQEIIEYQDNFSVGRTPIKEITEIIGRDITLEDVLRVMPKKIYINSRTGKFGHFHNHNHFVPPIIWQLGEPLFQQKLETIDFLYDLICKNNDIMEDIKPCPHGRPNPQSCPHCMGWNFPKNN